MVIYWSRCDICGKYIIVRECTLAPGVSVCPHCCILFCDNRGGLCRAPTWYPEVPQKTKLRRKEEKEKVEKVLMDLLKKLETTKR